jgi:hypothetical protein
VDINTTAGCAGVLTTALDTPVVAETTVSPNLLHALKRVTKLNIYVVRTAVDALASLVILLPVKEPNGDLELEGVLHDSDDTLDFIGVKFTSTLAGVNLGLLAHEIGKAPADALNGCECELQKKFGQRFRQGLNITTNSTRTTMFLRPSMFVFIRRKMCWKSGPSMRDYTRDTARAGVSQQLG